MSSRLQLEKRKMGAWGSGAFENDDAMDWVGELKALGAEDVGLILVEATTEAEYLEAPACSIAVAAAEAVATLNGTPAAHIPKEVVQWARAHGRATPELLDSAVNAVRRIRTNSELKDLWQESDGFDEWSRDIQDLERRLTR
jgi:hypothetical protein